MYVSPKRADEARTPYSVRKRTARGAKKRRLGHDVGTPGAHRAALAPFAKASCRALSGNWRTLCPFSSRCGCHGMTRHAGGLLVDDVAADRGAVCAAVHLQTIAATARSSRVRGRIVGWAPVRAAHVISVATGKKDARRTPRTSGNLDERVLGDIRTLTVAEYRARSPG